MTSGLCVLVHPQTTGHVSDGPAAWCWALLSLPEPNTMRNKKPGLYCRLLACVLVSVSAEPSCEQLGLRGLTSGLCVLLHPQTTGQVPVTALLPGAGRC